ncbi:sporulation integral membrane protein YlbJ [Alicyclobacillus sp. ALC3]|uniref:sporulation integral membrane protein YlbJ n=1 Tax=Alicyclobacillus sp. ALC3 TaxID=2796143 RepID=UPI002378FB92|nr:sporulation integral membrane protein YlbJ [Alicyclobacillus sp. ALC3]
MNAERKSRLSTVLLGLMVVLFTFALVLYPKQGFEAGLSGMRLFWNTVFPSLLPFFILAEFMLGLGVVKGFGVLLEPLMRPLFGVPGVGAFALSMGLAAGYPMDAVITARFRSQKLCSRIEGERLLAFTNTADPLFMIGAVAVGMFKSPEIGGLLAIAHYISSFLVGVSFKLWGRKAEREEVHEAQTVPTSVPRGNIFARAFNEMIAARQADGRAFGQIMRDAVVESMQTLIMICGFIVFFAVLIDVLRISGMMALIGAPIAFIYHIFGINGGLVPPTIAGALEIDVGAAQTAAVVAAPMVQKLALVSAIIAWSGLSVHAQVASVLTQTDIRMRPYFLARVLHAGLAAVVTVVLYGLGMGHAGKVFANLTPMSSLATAATGQSAWWHVLLTSLDTWVVFFAVLAVLSLLWWTVRKVRLIAWRV